MEETEDESTDAEGKGEEDMVHADMMAAGCDAEEGDLENLELDIKECQNRNVPRNRHCGSREAPNEKKNKPAKEQWKFVVDPTSEPSWSDVALYEEDLHRKDARSIMTPQPNMSTTSEASTTRWKRSQSRRAKKRWRRRTLTCTWSQSIQRSVCDVGKEMVMRMQIQRSSGDHVFTTEV